MASYPSAVLLRKQLAGQHASSSYQSFPLSYINLITSLVLVSRFHIRIIDFRTLIYLTLSEFRKRPVDGFSAGLVDDNDVYEWDITIFGYIPPLVVDCFYKASELFKSLGN